MPNFNRLSFSKKDIKKTKKANNISNDNKKSKFSNNNGHILKSSITKHENNNATSNSSTNNIKHKKIISSKLNTSQKFVKNGKKVEKNEKKMDDINDYFSKK